jgi:hypothetical protein
MKIKDLESMSMPSPENNTEMGMEEKPMAEGKPGLEGFSDDDLMAELRKRGFEIEKEGEGMEMEAAPSTMPA